MSRLNGVIHLTRLPGSPGYGRGVKIDGVVTEPVDPVRAASFVKATR